MARQPVADGGTAVCRGGVGRETVVPERGRRRPLRFSRKRCGNRSGAEREGGRSSYSPFWGRTILTCLVGGNSTNDVHLRRKTEKP